MLVTRTCERPSDVEIAVNLISVASTTGILTVRDDTRAPAAAHQVGMLAQHSRRRHKIRRKDFNVSLDPRKNDFGNPQVENHFESLASRCPAPGPIWLGREWALRSVRIQLKATDAQLSGHSTTHSRGANQRLLATTGRVPLMNDGQA